MQNISSEFRVRDEVRHERIQGNGGSDMGAGEVFNNGGVGWDDRVAFPTDSFVKRGIRLGACKSLGLSQSTNGHGL